MFILVMFLLRMLYLDIMPDRYYDSLSSVVPLFMYKANSVKGIDAMAEIINATCMELGS